MYKKSGIVIFIFLAISFFLLRHAVPAGYSAVQVISSASLYPLLRIQQKIILPVAQWFERRATIEELQMQLQSLHKENEELLADNIALRSSLHYAAEIKEVCDFNKRYALSGGHVAQVLVRHISPTQNFFLVDVGSSKGIKKDMVAIYSNALVGRVVEVYPWYCKVSLITDADCKVACFCIARNLVNRKNVRNKASGIHEGTNDLEKSAVRFVSHLESVEPEELVVSSGEGLVFPQGFALGTIVEAHKGDLFYSIAVKPTLNFSELSYCTIIAKEDMQKSSNTLLLQV